MLFFNINTAINHRQDSAQRLELANLKFNKNRFRVCLKSRI
jgi:hypothetical protein